MILALAVGLLVADWTGSNWVSWYPDSGNYWVYVESRTSDGTVESYCTAYQVTARYEIMGTTSTNLAQMVAYYNANNTYPEFYASSDAPTIETFCRIYLEECQAEGLKAEVAFCQAMLETGFLRYGVDVQINQYNFAGLGATGNGAPGNSFGSVREGIRAMRGYPVPTCKKRNSTLCRMAWNPGEPIWKRLGDC